MISWLTLLQVNQLPGCFWSVRQQQANWAKPLRYGQLLPVMTSSQSLRPVDSVRSAWPFPYYTNYGHKIPIAVYKHTNPYVLSCFIGRKVPSLYPFLVYLTNDVTLVDRIKRGRIMLSMRNCSDDVLQTRLGPNVQLLFSVSSGHTQEIRTWSPQRWHCTNLTCGMLHLQTTNQ